MTAPTPAGDSSAARGGTTAGRSRHRAASVVAAVAAVALFAEGVVPRDWAWPFFGAVAVAAVVVAAAPPDRSRGPARGLLVFAAVCVAATTVDLALRLVASFTHRIPDERTERTPRFPAVKRFVPGTEFDGETSGDVARMTGLPQLDEPRRIHFRADEWGCRNDEVSAATPADVVCLGDSFGALAGLSQEKTWPCLLRERHAVATYNLSVPWGSPWHEFVQLAASSGRLRVRPGAVLVWTLFAGNDLDEFYGDTFDVERLPSQGWIGQACTAQFNWANRSPVASAFRRLLDHEQGVPASVVDRKLPDGLPILFFRPYVDNRSRSYADVLAHRNYPMFAAAFGAMRRLAEASGLRLSIACLPMKEDVYAWVLDGTAPWSRSYETTPFAHACEVLARENGIRFTDLGPGFTEAAGRSYADGRQLLWWRDDTHWNERGSSVAADLIWRDLLAATAERK